MVATGTIDDLKRKAARRVTVDLREPVSVPFPSLRGRGGCQQHRPAVGARSARAARAGSSGTLGVSRPRPRRSSRSSWRTSLRATTLDTESMETQTSAGTSARVPHPMLAVLAWRSAVQGRYVLLGVSRPPGRLSDHHRRSGVSAGADALVRPHGRARAGLSAARARQPVDAARHVQGHRRLRLLSSGRRRADLGAGDLLRHRAGARGRVRPGRSHAGAGGAAASWS